jgi:hypothetical protein
VSELALPPPIEGWYAIDVMAESEKDRAARELIEWHYSIEPDLELVYRVITDNEDDPDEPIKLVEINAAAVSTGRFSAFGFAPTKDFAYHTIIAELTRDELESLRNQGKIPPGWNLASAMMYRRPEAA